MVASEAIKLNSPRGFWISRKKARAAPIGLATSPAEARNFELAPSPHVRVIGVPWSFRRFNSIILRQARVFGESAEKDKTETAPATGKAVSQILNQLMTDNQVT